VNEVNAGYPIVGQIYWDSLREVFLVFQMTRVDRHVFSYLLGPDHETLRRLWEMSHLEPVSEMEALARIASQ
jgi:hypothetical protein